MCNYTDHRQSPAQCLHHRWWCAHHASSAQTSHFFGPSPLVPSSPTSSPLLSSTLQAKLTADLLVTSSALQSVSPDFISGLWSSYSTSARQPVGTILAPPSSLVPQPPSWSDIALPMPLTSSALAALHLSTPTAPLAFPLVASVLCYLGSTLNAHLCGSV